MANKYTESTTVTQATDDDSIQRRGIRLSDETWRKIKVIAAKTDQTTSDVVEIALAEYAKRHSA